MTSAMNIVYRLGDKLYINLTNRCSCDCTFCLRNAGDGAHGSDTLWLTREPTTEEVMEAFAQFPMEEIIEIVFCGYGEPTEALDVLLPVAQEVKSTWDIPLRLDTNGQGSLINGRDIVPDLAKSIDRISISLNTPDAAEYLQLTRSEFGDEAYGAMLEFAREAKECGMDVTLTTVETTLTPEQEEECKQICDNLGATYRIRSWVE